MFKFTSSNNQVEYEALLTDMIFALEMEAIGLTKSDSHLVTKQVSGKHPNKDPLLIKYLQKVHYLSLCFLYFDVTHVPRNLGADHLSKMATTKVAGVNRTTIQETLASPNIKEDKAYSLKLVPKLIWISHILHYLQLGELPLDEREARNIKRKVGKYTLLSRKIYRMSKVIPMLRYLNKNDIDVVLTKVHKVASSSRIDGKSLTHKLLCTCY